MRHGFAISLGLLLPAVLPPPSQSAPANEKIDFAADIQPILKAHCYKCHGPDKQESGLRLHVKSAAMAGGDNGAAIVSGKSGDSPLVRRIAGIGDDARMPPEDEGKALSPSRSAKIRRVDRPRGGVARFGGRWPKQPAANTGPTKSQSKRRCRRSANRRGRTGRSTASFSLGWTRRVCGPRPSTSERGCCAARHSTSSESRRRSKTSMRFCADGSPDAYERASIACSLRRATASGGPPRGSIGLDTPTRKAMRRTTAARSGAYRDWVIDALNRNLPFDQFTIEQLAGDLLPTATPEQKLATAFHRNTMTNTEGGTDNEEFRVAAVVDRVNTTWDVWMATTFACCQCHSHKYDPFTQREYYQFFAFFNHTADADNDNEAPTMPTPSAAEDRELAKLQTEVAGIGAAAQVAILRSSNRRHGAA